MGWMRGLALFVAGIAVGTVVMQSSAAQQNTNTGLRLQHVGIAVKDIQASVDYFTKVMGFRVAFRFPSPDGRPSTTYLQISRDTFLEVGQAGENATPGITHMGIVTADQKATITRIRQAGGMVTDSRPSANTSSNLANVTDPSGIRLELVEYTPDSLHKKAEDSWR